ncbi:MAG: right-handed parallel beta-helix repeat-containing protein [Deltaproteobacteria bacterium]|nr:right-handed parallel beta-helix repeat-containing protein [Deltaproteobacteria bacterium]
MNRRLQDICLVAVSAAFLFCSGGPGGTDAGEDGTADPAGDWSDAPDIGIEPPEMPEPVSLGPCPIGWRDATGEGTDPDTCEPWPVTGPEDCGPGEAHFPGDPGCTRLGPACPSVDWADDLPTGGDIVYVRAGEAPGGDGTSGSPCGTIADGLTTAAGRSGVIVALSTGTYDELVALRGDVTLWGACASGTILTSSTPSTTAGVVLSSGHGPALRNLTITGARPGVWVYGSGRDIDLENVVIERTTGTGVFLAAGGGATGRRVVVRDTLHGGNDDFDGTGIQLITDGTLELEYGSIAFNRGAGLHVEGSEATLSFVAIRDTRTRDGSGRMGLGIEAGVSSTLTANAVVVERSHTLGVLLDDSHAVLQDVIVRDTLPQASDGQYGGGIEVLEGSTLELVRGLVSGNRARGILVLRSQATMHDVVMSDHLPIETTGMAGNGLDVQQASRVWLTRGYLARNQTVAIVAGYSDSTLSLQDVTIVDTQPRTSDQILGGGIQVSDGIHVTALRILLEGNHAAGIVAGHEGTLLQLTDVTVRDTLSQISDGKGGRGLSAESGCRVEVVRGAFVGNREVGIVAIHPGTTLVMSHVLIRDTQERACAVDTCAGFGAGTGIISCGGAHVDLELFEISHSVMCGLQLATCVLDEGGTADLSQGIVSGNAVGANVQTEGFDVERLMDGVSYFDNDRDLDMDSLPVPDVGAWL